MPNWCSTAYVLEGDAKEIKNLYDLMKELQEREEPSVKNDFGTAWLGCLVDALGKDWRNVNCRGAWFDLQLVGETLRFTTETAWAPCDETLQLVCEKFQSVGYYYRTEEPGMAIYETNDCDGRYFPEKYNVEVYTDEEEFYCEVFVDECELFKWFEELTGQSVKSRKDIDRIQEQWREENDYAYYNINEYTVVY